MTDLVAWDILKWVLLVLLAGFIGQFGRSFAQAVLARLRRKKGDAAAPAAPADLHRAGGTEGAGGNGRVTVPGRAGEAPSPAPEPPPADSAADKKAQKALAKQQKKEEKLRLKGEKKS